MQLSNFAYTGPDICGPLIYSISYPNESAINPTTNYFNATTLEFYVKTNDDSNCNDEERFLLKGMY